MCPSERLPLGSLPSVVAGSSRDRETAQVRERSVCRTAYRRAKRASDRHCHLPSVLGGTRGLCIVQHVPVDELEEPSDVLHDVEIHTATD